MGRALYLLAFASLVFFYCSPTDSDKTKSDGPYIHSSDSQKPPVNFNLVMASTGRVSGSLAKRALSSFTYPVKEWIPSAFFTGCPEYIKLNLTSIEAWGNWMTIKVHTDTIIPEVPKDSTSNPDSFKYWDSIVVKYDTSFHDGFLTLWTGEKEITFDGTPVSLADFDTLHIPRGTIYFLRILADPLAKIKGSISGNFTRGKIGDSVVTEVKTYYTKANYAWNAQTDAGGTTDPTVYETGPAEETPIVIAQFDTSIHGIKDGQIADQIYSLIINNPCTTSVQDSLRLTMLFDISRILSFYNGDTCNVGMQPRGASAEKAFFYAHEAFCGDGIGIATVFPGRVGKIFGYATEFVWNNQANIDSSSGPGLNSDTTLGSRGWLTMVYNAGDTLIGGKMFIDNASFSPKGSLSSFDPVTGLLMLCLNGNAAKFYIYDFIPKTTIGEYCYCRTYSPAWTYGGVTCEARSGEIKFTLALKQ